MSPNLYVAQVRPRSGVQRKKVTPFPTPGAAGLTPAQQRDVVAKGKREPLRGAVVV
ncbi:MAG: hypothetical protein HY695_08280 [Deltaproteobacteria bacterium]|nr:hypothetical protein [Deltaproteobacteria bacterium]